MSITVAALYVETNGVYYGLPDVDPWDEARDARLYDGPWPVVAHPPCASWSIMGNCRPETRAKGDGGTFAAALDAVRRFGGVLEQPAYSRAWDVYALPLPMRGGGWSSTLTDSGWSCWVDQRRYGHEARKPTWLYYVGPEPSMLVWGRGERGELTVGRGWGGRQHLRSRTPVAFRDVLLDLARSASPGNTFG